MWLNFFLVFFLDSTEYSRSFRTKPFSGELRLLSGRERGTHIIEREVEVPWY